MEIRSARFVSSAQDPSGYPTDGLPQVAVAGRSNVGKSSLLNMLMQRKKLVKTSATPGKTQLINFFLVNETPSSKPGAQGAFYLVDIPGFGYARKGGDAKRGMEKAIESFFRGSKSLKGLLYLVDSRVTDSPVDEEALGWLEKFGTPLLIVATKSDKLKRVELAKALADIASRHGMERPPIATSSEEVKGREEVMEQIALLLAGDATALPGSTGS
jgi:GTP-binding protein